MADLSEGVPERVWTKAQQLGLHSECILAESPCERCERHVMLGFEFYYGDSQSLDEVIGAIVHDIATDLERALNEN